MSATVTQEHNTVFGNKRVTVSKILPDATYPTGGEAVTAAQLGLSKVDFASATIRTTATTTVNVANAAYDTANSKLVLFDETPAELANDADVAGLVVQVIAYGS